MHHWLKLALVLVALILSILTTMKTKKLMDTALPGNKDAKSAYGMSVTTTVLLAILLVWCLVAGAKGKGYSLSSLSHYL